NETPTQFLDPVLSRRDRKRFRARRSSSGEGRIVQADLGAPASAGLAKPRQLGGGQSAHRYRFPPDASAVAGSFAHGSSGTGAGSDASSLLAAVGGTTDPTDSSEAHERQFRQITRVRHRRSVCASANTRTARGDSGTRRGSGSSF